MGLKCKISYDGGVAIVTDNNGNPSKLYSAALSITQNQELALNMWATAYSKEFGEKGEKADLEDLVKFMDATASTDSVLSPSEKFQVKDFMVRNGFTSLDQLYSELASIFKPNGYFDMDVKKAIDSGLYTEDEIRNLNPDAIDDILVKIEGNITVDDFKVSPATETEFYKNTDNKTIFGTYERVTREDIDKAILDSIEDFNDDLDFYNKISELPFPEFSDRFYNDEEFANTIINKFRGLKRIPNLHIDGETITDQDLSFYTTVKNTILSNIDTTSMEADIEYLDSIDQDIWESNDNLVVSVLNEVEMTFAEANIDVLGIRQKKHRRGEVMELLESALALAKNPSNENLNAYIQAHNQLIPKVDKQIAYRLPSKYDSYNIVRVFSNKSQDELYNKFGLIKVADNLYHKVDQNASPTAIAQEIYQQLKDKNIEIEELKGIDFDNKPKALASISEYLMLKPTESTITNKESYTGYQVVFNHDALPDTSEDVKQLADIRTDETYLKTKFISDFYNYVLFEKALDSDIYKKVLSKFSFTDSGIVLNDFVDSIADVEYKTELQDYIRLKRDTNMKHLLPKVEGVLTEDVLYTNMPGKKSEYEGDFIMDQEFIITNPTADEFIKMDGQIYRKVLERENAHMFEMFIPNSVMFGEDANYYTTLTEAPSEIDRARQVFNQYGDTSPNAVDLTQFEEVISRARLDDNLRSDLADLSTLKNPSYTFIINKLGVVAYKNGKRVGSIRAKYSDNQYSDEEISVAENHRGKGIGTELYVRFFDKISREDATFLPADIRTKQAQNIYSRMEDMLEMQPDGSVKVRPQETEGVTWQQVADLEISQKELNNLRTSIRNRDKDSYTAEILDEVSKAMKGENFNLPFELDFLADGITYNDVANLLMQDEIFETRTEIRNFISNRLTPPTAGPAFQEVLEPTKVYHVTNSYNIESINRDGLLTANEDGNFKNAKGESFDTKGKSYVFEDMNDALDWAVKMDLEANGSIGTGNISIVAIDKAGLEMQEDQALAGMAKMIGGPFGSSKFVTTNIPSSAIFGITRFDNKKNAKERLESNALGKPAFQEVANEGLIQSSNPSWGWRAGKIDGRVPETLASFRGGRGTGHFGTGFYFFGKKEQAEGYSGGIRAERPINKVDFNLYDLLKIGPSSEHTELGHRLHSALKEFQYYSIKSLSKERYKDKALTPKIIESQNTFNVNIKEDYIESLLDNGFKDDFKRFLEENSNKIMKEVNEEFPESFKDKSDFDFSVKYDLKNDKYIKNMLRNSVKLYIEQTSNRSDLSRDTVFFDAYSTSAESFVNEYVKNNIESLKEEGTKSEAFEAVFSDNISELADVVSKLDPTRWSKEAAEKKIRENIVKLLRRDPYLEAHWQKTTVGTELIKLLGYNGIDARFSEDGEFGLSSLNTSTYGSVIYDLTNFKNPKDIKFQQQDPLGLINFYNYTPSSMMPNTNSLNKEEWEQMMSDLRSNRLSLVDYLNFTLTMQDEPIYQSIYKKLLEKNADIINFLEDQNEILKYEDPDNRDLLKAQKFVEFFEKYKDKTTNAGFARWVQDNERFYKDVVKYLSGGSTRYQQENMDRLRIVPKEAFDAVAKRLEMTGLSPNSVVTDKQAFVRGLRDANKENRSQAVAKNVYGFTLDNTVFINKDKLNFNTAIHEFGHLWAAWARDVRKDLYDKGKELVKDSKYMDEVREKAKNPESVYHNMNDEQLVEEALVTAIGDRGEAFINEKKKEGFLGWLQDLWDAISKAVGLTQMSTDAVQNLTLDEFAQAVAIDLLKGDTFQSAPYTITALTNPMIAKREGKMVNVQTIRQILKQAGTKQIEKDIIEEVLELEGFKGKDKIPFDDFKTQVNVRVMPLTVIESKTQSSYGSENVDTEADKFVTNIYNTDMDHGITGHFPADFRDEELKQQDLEIRIIDSTNGAKFAVVRKDVTLTEENLQDNVFNVFSIEEQAKQWIKDYNKSLPIKNQGLFGHTRVWTDTETKDVYVAELQSDTYQKKKLDDAIMMNYELHPERMNEKQKEFWDKLSAVRTLNTQVTLAKEVYDEGRFSPERKKYLGIGVLSKEISDFVSRSKRIPLDKNHKELLDNYVRLSEGKDIEMPSFDDSERVSTDTQRLFSNGIFVVEESGGTEGVYRLPFNSQIQKRTTTFRTINLTREEFIANGLENEEYLTSPDRNLMEILGALSENDKRYIFSEKMIPDSFVEIINGLRGDGITVSRIKEILSDYQVIKDRKELVDLVDKISEIYDRVSSSVGSIERGQLTDAQILRKQITKAQSENSSNLENLKRDLKIYQQYTLEGYKSSRLSTLIEQLEALPQDKVIKLGKVKKSEYVLSRDLTKLDEFGLSEAKMDKLSGSRSMKSSNLNVLFKIFKESLSGVIDPETYKEHYIGNRDKGKYIAGILDNMPVRDKQFVAHRKNYTDRLLREEIRRNAEKGMKTLSIPTPRTLALIQGYIEDEGQMPYTIDGRKEDDKSDLQAGDEIGYLGSGYVVVNTYRGDDTIYVADMSEVYGRGKQSDFAEMLAESEKDSLMSELEEFFRKNYRTVDSIYYADRPSMSNYEFSDNLLESPIGAIESIEGIGYTIKGTDEIAVFLPKSNNPTKKQAEDVLKDIVKDMAQEYDEEMPYKFRFIEGTLEEENEARKKLQVLNMMDPDKKDKEVQSKIEALKNDIDNSSNFIDDISELHPELDFFNARKAYDGLSLSDIAKPVGTTIYGATIYEIDLNDSNLKETVKEHFKNKYNKEDRIYDYLYDQGYSVYQDVRDGETYFTAVDKRGMGNQSLKQPSQYGTQSIEDFKIEDMLEYEKTILKKYEELNKKFKKERPDAEIINDANGNEWFRTKLTEDDGAKPVVAFQEEKTKDFEIAGEAIRQVDNLRKLIPENIQQKSQILSGKRELTEVGKKMGVEDYKPNRTDLEVASIFLTGNRFRTLDEREQNRVSQWADDWLNDAFIDEKKFDELAENYEDELGTDLFATEEEKQRESDITMGLIDLSKVGRDEFIIDFFKGDLFEAAEEARRRGMIKIPQSIIDRAREKSAKENVENISTIFDSQLELLNLYTPKEGNDIRRDIDSCGG